MNNETDKELLEFAAKAAGVKDEMLVFGWWSPLTDDGDALRLAVKLKLCVAITDHGVNVSEVGWRSWREVQHPDDPYAASRRAIVRAAAEIGKAIGQKPVSALPDDNYEKNQAEAFYSDSFGKEANENT
jgi:hypothetical protein